MTANGMSGGPVVGLLLAVCLALTTPAGAAYAATGDVGYKDGSISGTAAPTGTKRARKRVVVQGRAVVGRHVGPAQLGLPHLPARYRHAGVERHTVAATWSESTVTWNTRPAITGSPVATLGAVGLDTFVEFDLTGTITGNGSSDLALKSGSGDTVYYNSREGGHPP